MKLLTIVFLLLLAVCPDQQFLSTAGLDESRIAKDPASGNLLLLGKLYAYVGEPVRIVGFACDPDNDDPDYPPQTLKLWREPGGEILAIDPNGNYEFTVQYTNTGWHYENVALTDGMALRLATVAIYTRQNQPPSIGCRSANSGE